MSPGIWESPSYLRSFRHESFFQRGGSTSQPSPVWNSTRNLSGNPISHLFPPHAGSVPACSGHPARSLPSPSATSGHQSPLGMTTAGLVSAPWSHSDPWAPVATSEDLGVTSSPCSSLSCWCWKDFGRSSLHCVWSKLERWARRELGQRLAGGKRITDKFIPLINKGINDDAVKKKQDSLEKTVARPRKEERCLDNSFTLYCLVKNVLF